MLNRNIYICVTPFFPSPENWRGAYVLDQVKAIQRNSDYEVKVFKPGKSIGSYIVDDITVHTFKTYETPSFLFNGLFDGLNGRIFRKFVAEIGLDFDRIAFVHCHTCHFAAYGLALKKAAPHAKVLVQHHDLDPFQIRNGMFSNWKLNARYRAKTASKLFNNVDVHVCVSSPVKDSLLSFPNARPQETFKSYLDSLQLVKGLPPIKPKKVYVLFNGVDVSIFNVKNKPCRENDYFRIGCLGNFEEVKDQMVLIKAFGNLINKGYKNLRLSLLGSGSSKQKHVDYINEHGLTKFVEWNEEVTHENLPSFYQSLDLFVLPSVFEGFGCVYLEAAACGVPYICVEHQGAAEYILDEEKEQWLMRPKDVLQLEQLILNVLNKRSQQHYKYSISIDSLVSNFLDEIANM